MHATINEAINKINTIILGKEEQVSLAFACLLAKGHLLIEDLPGMGKTTLSSAIANTVGLSYSRVQFTSDLLPADITGVSVFNQQSGEFQFHKGPVFNQVILADEINRSGPKTQSALLEAMEERQVTMDGKTYDLPSPFFVIATQNPLYQTGTFSLPESQLDRFLMRISLGYPNYEAEKKILLNQDYQAEKVEAVITPEQLASCQQQVTAVNVSDHVLDYIIRLGAYTRQAEFEGLALSPRASKAVLNASKAWAFINQRDFVMHEDVQHIFAAVAEHRIKPQISTHQQESFSAKVLANVAIMH